MTPALFKSHDITHSSNQFIFFSVSSMYFSLLNYRLYPDSNEETEKLSILSEQTTQRRYLTKVVTPSTREGNSVIMILYIVNCAY